MHFEVEHLTSYRYSEPVALGPQTLRLRPRPDGRMRELGFSLLVEPAPALRAEALDAEGNLVTRLWFEVETRRLNIVSRFTVDTDPKGTSPLLSDARYAALPLDYPPGEGAVLAPYRSGGEDSPLVRALAEKLNRQASKDPLAFLARLNDHLFRHIEREIRDEGAPQSPAETLARGRGACRDQTLLFLAVARAQGFAGRFVSGYQDRSAIDTPERYLHAWPEVYLPGFGWQGFDPTRGITAGSGHVAVAAARDPAGAMPVEGSYFGSGGSELSFEMRIHTDGQEPSPISR
jgi:transglutaminase-like putative cysteine protease